MEASATAEALRCLNKGNRAASVRGREKTGTFTPFLGHKSLILHETLTGKRGKRPRFFTAGHELTPATEMKLALKFEMARKIPA